MHTPTNSQRKAYAASLFKQINTLNIYVVNKLQKMGFIYKAKQNAFLSSYFENFFLK